MDGCRCGVCRLGLAGFRARRYFDSVCGCGGAGVCIGPFGRMVAEKGFEPCIRFDVCDGVFLDFVVGIIVDYRPYAGRAVQQFGIAPAPINRFYAEHAAAVVEKYNRRICGNRSGIYYCVASGAYGRVEQRA